MFYSRIYSDISIRAQYSIDTLEIDEKEIKFNPGFIKQLTAQELVFIIIHEIGHLLLLDEPRSIGRDLKVWNIACDLYINKAIKNEIGENSNLVKMPKHAVYWDALDLMVDTEESIYDELMASLDKSCLEKLGVLIFSLEKQGKSISFCVKNSNKQGNENESKEYYDNLRSKYIYLLNKHIDNRESKEFNTLESICKKHYLEENRDILQFCD